MEDLQELNFLSNISVYAPYVWCIYKDTDERFFTNIPFLNVYKSFLGKLKSISWVNCFFPPSGRFDLLGYALPIRAKTRGNKELRVFNDLSLKFTVLGTRYYRVLKQEKGLIWGLQRLAAFSQRGYRTKYRQEIKTTNQTPLVEIPVGFLSVSVLLCEARYLWKGPNRATPMPVFI